MAKSAHHAPDRSEQAQERRTAHGGHDRGQLPSVDEPVRLERQLVNRARAEVVRSIDLTRTVVVAEVVGIGRDLSAFEQRVAGRRVAAARQRVRDLRLDPVLEAPVQRGLRALDEQDAKIV